MVLFSLPIYALSEKTFNKRYERERLRFINDDIPLSSQSNAEFVRNCCTVHLGKYSIWKYNHIVGYVEVCLSDSGNDIYLDVYRPVAPVKRYHWMSSKKILLKRIIMVGMHFRCIGKTNDQIVCEIDLLLDELQGSYGINKCFVDRTQYDSVKNHIDFVGLIGECGA